MMPQIDRCETSENSSADRPPDHIYHHESTDVSSPSLLKSYSFAGAVSLAGTFTEKISWAEDARPLLPKAAFFMGDLRDGIPMVRKRLY